MRNTRSLSDVRSRTVFAAAMSATALTPMAAQAADAVLCGTIKSADGEALGGVTVSARAEGSNIVTSVFTDEAGNYYFPPMAEGKYKVWAQAITFDIGRGDVMLGGAKRQDFALKPLKDFVAQLPGDMVLAALPDATPEDANMKTIVQNNCTACHTPSYILQHKFDEAGWNAIINLMKHANVYGIYQGPDHKASPTSRSQSEAARRLPRPRARPRRDLDEVQSAAAPDRRSRPRGVHRLRGAGRSGRRHALQGADQQRHRLVARHAVLRLSRASACMTPGSMPTAEHLFHLQCAEQCPHAGQVRPQDRRLQAPEGRGRQRPRGAGPRHHPRSRPAPSGST